MYFKLANIFSINYFKIAYKLYINQKSWISIHMNSDENLPEVRI